MRLRQTYFFFSLPDSAIAHNINQYEIGPFLITSQAPNGLLTDVGMVKKGFGNEPLKDVTMERVRVEEFKESLLDRKSTRLNSSHLRRSRMPSSA